MGRVLAVSVAASVAVPVAVVPPHVAYAEPAPVTGVELGTTIDQSVAVDSRFDFTDAYTIGLPQLRKVRGQMWDINPPFNDTSLRRAAAEAGLGTKEAYVNAATIDPNLSRIAVQRAAEQPVGSLSHLRGKSIGISVATINGRAAHSEIIAYGRLEDAISKMWGHGELDVLKKANGYYKHIDGRSNGHLHIMLDPENRDFGFGEVTITHKGRGHVYSVGVVGGSPFGGAALEKGRKELYLYRQAREGESPTGLKEYTPHAPAPNVPQDPVPGAPDKPKDKPSSDGSSASDPGMIVGIVVGLLALLGVLGGLFHSNLMLAP